MEERERDTGYALALLGVKGIFRLLILILILILFLFLARQSYVFGFALFNEEPMAEAPGEDVVLVLPEGLTVRELAGIMKERGLIADELVFQAQERLSVYHDKLLPGTYILNTSMTPSEMLEILAGVNTEGQPAREGTDDGGQS